MFPATRFAQGNSGRGVAATRNRLPVGSAWGIGLRYELIQQDVGSVPGQIPREQGDWLLLDGFRSLRTGHFRRVDLALHYGVPLLVIALWTVLGPCTASMGNVIAGLAILTGLFLALLVFVFQVVSALRTKSTTNDQPNLPASSTRSSTTPSMQRSCAA